jgi:ATP-dependent Clp protease ATP-binding subunit ClpA
MVKNMNSFDKLTNYSQEILAQAQNIMAAHKNFEMQPEHILMAMIKDVDGVSGDYLKELK